MNSRLLPALLAAALLPFASSRAQTFTHTEARHTHSIALTPDGTRLLAVQSEAALLSVFDATGADPGALPLLAEIPVGLEPVAVRARTDDEVWVVSELGDSVSIVSLDRGAVVAVLRTPDEPADIVFAQGRAFITCARSNLVRVFDAETRSELGALPLEGLVPRSLATDAAGEHVFAAFLHSGNRTTILPRSLAPAQPAPANPALPAAPRTALIVPGHDSRLAHTVLDHDVAEIDPATLTIVRYLSGAGTSLLDLAVQPGTGDVFVANTEARNLVRFEPALRGHIVDNRITRFAALDGAAAVFDLNPGIDHTLLPNPAAQAAALAQPTALAFSASGTELWVAAFGSDRIAKISPSTGAILATTDLRAPGETSRQMRGPRALALDPAGERLFVLNKLSGTISIVGAATGALLGEFPAGSRHPMPAPLREGRGFLFDARLSGNGTVSCASCHIDADRDGLAWDLGDPAGGVATVMGANLSAHDTRPRPRSMHPMKGPMTTQTLRGMAGGAPFHWRGDRPTLQSFNITFDALMGGAQLAPEDIDALAAYLLSLRHHPNPYRLPDGGLPASIGAGDPLRGKSLFSQHLNHCNTCHTLPRTSDNNIDLPAEVGASQPIKNPTLATVYQRVHFDPRPGAASLSGFGLLHDGTGAGHGLPTVHPYVLDVLSGRDFADVSAFVLASDTGTAPAVGDSVLATAGASQEILAIVSRLESQNQASAADLIVRGMIAGEARRFIFSRTLQLYVPDDSRFEPLSRAALIASLGAEDALFFMGVPYREGGRFTGGLAPDDPLIADSFFTRSKAKPFVVPAESGVLANDLRVAPPSDIAVLAASPTRGAAHLAADGSLTYTPGAAFTTTGFDSFTYQVRVDGDPSRATAETTATLSTFASAAGRYFATLADESTGEIGGFASIVITARGTWTGKVRLGAAVQPLKGAIRIDGAMQPARTSKLDLTLRLATASEARHTITAAVRTEATLDSATLHRPAFSKASPPSGVGRHRLVLEASSLSDGAPSGVGSALLRIGKTGAARLSGRLGEGTAFSCAAPLAMPGPATPGGWTLPVFAPVFRSPPGHVAGALDFSSSRATAIEGRLTAWRPQQTKPPGAAPPFTIRYDARSIPEP
jgi:DNA-binding beta-propeller fold protein YncE